VKRRVDQSSTELMWSIRFNEASPDVIYAIFKTNGSFMTRIMIDFLDLPEQKVKIRHRRGGGRNDPDEGKCIYRESSILFITQPDRQ